MVLFASFNLLFSEFLIVIQSYNSQIIRELQEEVMKLKAIIKAEGLEAKIESYGKTKHFSNFRKLSYFSETLGRLVF